MRAFCLALLLPAAGFAHQASVSFSELDVHGREARPQLEADPLEDGGPVLVFGRRPVDERDDVVELLPRPASCHGAPREDSTAGPRPARRGFSTR